MRLGPVGTCFKRGAFLDISDVTIGNAAMGCWTGRSVTTKDVLKTLGSGSGDRI